MRSREQVRVITANSKMLREGSRETPSASPAHPAQPSFTLAGSDAGASCAVMHTSEDPKALRGSYQGIFSPVPCNEASRHWVKPGKSRRSQDTAGAVGGLAGLQRPRQHRARRIAAPLGSLSQNIGWGAGAWMGPQWLSLRIKTTSCPTRARGSQGQVFLSGLSVRCDNQAPLPQGFPSLFHACPICSP